MQEFDVAIIGGGLVGAVVARAIASIGLHAVIVDQTPAAQLYSSALDNRGLALAYTTAKYLKNINVWDKLYTHTHAITQVHVSQQNSFGFTKLSSTDAGIPHLGYVISASHLGKILVQDLEQLPQLSVLRPAVLNLAKFVSTALGWELLIDNKMIRAKLIIAADGTNSFMRKVIGAGVHTKDFAQTAIVANVSINKTHANVAYERFTALGVLALLPFGMQQMKCILTVANTNANELLNLTETEFLQLLQQNIGYRAGVFTKVTGRKAYPISTAYIDRMYDQNIFFIGNAANTLHPVAAQGFNLGVRDAITLANILRIVLQDPTVDPDLLGKNYVLARAADQKNSQEFSNNLVEIFGSERHSIQTGRKLGLMLTEFVPKLKARIIAQGLGLWM